LDNGHNPKKNKTISIIYWYYQRRQKWLIKRYKVDPQPLSRHQKLLIKLTICLQPDAIITIKNLSVSWMTFMVIAIIVNLKLSFGILLSGFSIYIGSL